MYGGKRGKAELKTGTAMREHLVLSLAVAMDPSTNEERALKMFGELFEQIFSNEEVGKIVKELICKFADDNFDFFTLFATLTRNNFLLIPASFNRLMEEQDLNNLQRLISNAPIFFSSAQEDSFVSQELLNDQGLNLQPAASTNLVRKGLYSDEIIDACRVTNCSLCKIKK